MHEPKETKPESPNALRRKEPGERTFDAMNHDADGSFGAWSSQTARDQGRWASIERRILNSFAPPDTSTESGLPSAGVDSITIPFPKPTKPTK